MKTYVFRLSDSFNGRVEHHAAEAANSTEAAQLVAARIGGHRLVTKLDYSREYDTRQRANSAAAVVIFHN